MGADVCFPFAKNANFITHAGIAQFADTQADVQVIRIHDRSAIAAHTLDGNANDRAI